MSDSYRAQAFGPQGWGVYDVAWTDGVPDFKPASGAAERTVVPGFVDIHVHGAFGIDFMSAGGASLRDLCAKLAEIGYEGFLPTTITASAQEVRRALDQLPQHPMILGFHLEGPFISAKFPGAQPPESILEPPLGASEWDPILDDPRLRVVTLAPELPGALELIRRLTKRGVIVSLGHSAATFAVAAAAAAAGARHMTHTFNAMRPLHHREAGMVGFALSGNVECELIYDRLHVSRQAAGILLTCRSADHVIGVSDGTMVSGLGDGKRTCMWAHEVETRNGGVYLSGTDTLAGSAITLFESFRCLAEDFGPETAARLCCINPRRALDISAPPQVYVEFDCSWEIADIRRKTA